MYNHTTSAKFVHSASQTAPKMTEVTSENNLAVSNNMREHVKIKGREGEKVREVGGKAKGLAPVHLCLLPTISTVCLVHDLLAQRIKQTFYTLSH